MITVEHSKELVATHLGDGLRARHSIFVAYLMTRLVEVLGEDAGLWEITGLCHDLDFEVTKADRSRHGLVTAEWLSGDLPDTALAAIQAHDHRTGFVADTVLAAALKFTDAIAVGELTIGRQKMIAALAAPNPRQSLELALTDRPYLTSMIVSLAQKLNVPLAMMAGLVQQAPSQ